MSSSLQELFQHIDQLSNDDFEAVINHVDKQRKRRVREIMAEAQRQASRFLQDSTDSNVKVRAPAKFRSPYDPSQTWSGFGRKPQWFIQYLNGGGREEDLAI